MSDLLFDILAWVIAILAAALVPCLFYEYQALNKPSDYIVCAFYTVFALLTILYLFEQI